MYKPQSSLIRFNSIQFQPSNSTRASFPQVTTQIQNNPFVPIQPSRVRGNGKFNRWFSALGRQELLTKMPPKLVSFRSSKDYQKEKQRKAISGQTQKMLRVLSQPQQPQQQIQRFQARSSINQSLHQPIHHQFEDVESEDSEIYQFINMPPASKRPKVEQTPVMAMPKPIKCRLCKKETDYLFSNQTFLCEDCKKSPRRAVTSTNQIKTSPKPDLSIDPIKSYERETPALTEYPKQAIRMPPSDQKDEAPQVQAPEEQSSEENRSSQLSSQKDTAQEVNDDEEKDPSFTALKEETPSLPVKRTRKQAANGPFQKGKIMKKRGRKKEIWEHHLERCREKILMLREQLELGEKNGINPKVRQQIRNKVSAQQSRLKKAYELQFLNLIIDTKDRKMGEFLELIGREFEKAGQTELLGSILKDVQALITPVDNHVQNEFKTMLINDKNPEFRRKLDMFSGQKVNTASFAKCGLQIFETSEQVKNRFEHNSEKHESDYEEDGQKKKSPNKQVQSLKRAKKRGRQAKNI